MARNSQIRYISRNFNNIRAELINYSQTYFPNTYTDFSPTSPGIMFMEQAAYVSDIMSFYLTKFKKLIYNMQDNLIIYTILLICLAINQK